MLLKLMHVKLDSDHADIVITSGRCNFVQLYKANILFCVKHDLLCSLYTLPKMIIQFYKFLWLMWMNVRVALKETETITLNNMLLLDDDDDVDEE